MSETSRKPARRDRLHEDLGELEPPRDRRLVVRVGDLAADRRQRDRGQHEQRDGELDLGALVAAAELEQDQQRQHLAHEIVVEGGEELAPEQRREAPRPHEFEHGSPRGIGRRRASAAVRRAGSPAARASCARGSCSPPRSRRARASSAVAVGVLDQRAQRLGAADQREVALQQRVQRLGLAPVAVGHVVGLGHRLGADLALQRADVARQSPPASARRRPPAGSGSGFSRVGGGRCARRHALSALLDRRRAPGRAASRPWRAP